MTVLDTGIVIEHVKRGKEIREYVTAITVAEFPPLLKYRKFYGKVLYPTREDINLAIEIQMRLRTLGKPKPFSDLLIAAICINRGEELITTDRNFEDIASVSALKLRLVR